MAVGTESLIDILINGITPPRLSTMVIAVVGILLLFAGIQSKMNRRRWATHLAFLEALGGDDDEGEGASEDSDLPAPVTAVEEEESDDYEEDEIELV